jgi:squalene-associated FAD-dependent desaturase
MAAALACADGGAEVTLIESRPRLGGATFSFRREGLWVDNGQHVFLRCCTAYRGFLRRIGSVDRTTLQPRLSIPVIEPGGRMGRLSRNGLPAPLHLAGAMARYPFLSPVERLRATGAALALARLDPRDPTLDERTFGSWLHEHGQSARAVEALWDLIALPTLNLHAGDASLALAVKVFRTGLLDDRGAADVGHATAPLSEVHGTAASSALSRAGAAVLTRTTVRRVVRSNGGGFEVEADALRIDADAVIAAVPHDRVVDILPPGAVREDVTLLGSSPIVNVHVVYDRAVMEVPFAAGLGTSVQWVFDRTGPSGLERGQYLAVSVSGADREIGERTEGLRGRFLPALAAMFPRALDARVEQLFVTREHRATFRQGPGKASLRPGPRTAVPGLFLAGAWTDTGWPATMEGAVRSGLAAARGALAGRASRAPIHEAVPA